ncbi:MAG: hypothetical protein DSM106950_38590 [Stigonema ocellatum SAG 48.90 = DSM 106950]|nr:hypothetical protein [Stigonema ocellatum SAG 48.90 = DSM 106950]
MTQLQDVTTICADQLTEGDIIQYRPGDNWMVITEPEYTTRGISFEVLCLDVEALNNTQPVCFDPQESFVLLDHQGTVRGRRSCHSSLTTEVIAVSEEVLAS